MPQPLQKMESKHKKAQLIVFDLDGTLAPSKSNIDQEMALLIENLLNKKLVAVISGGKYKRFQEQFLSKLRLSKELSRNLFLFPTNAASFYRYADGGWQEVYSEKLSNDEKKRIVEAFKKTFEELGYSYPDKIYGELIEDRGTEITFSALGQQAPLSLKEKWKKEHTSEKLKIAQTLRKYLPNMEVEAAGYTSIDVTRKGIDKEYGIQQIKKYLGISFDEMIFIGDSLFQEGNDSPVRRTGVPCVEVGGPEDTKKIVRYLLE